MYYYKDEIYSELFRLNRKLSERNLFINLTVSGWQF